MNNKGYIIVSDHVRSDGSIDVSEGIQKLIDENPNRTLYFPDGTYLISKPIRTPAEPTLSVDLQLSRFAIIKAAEDWNGDGALIRLGGSHPVSNIRTSGSFYSLCGGILDGSGMADGVSIDSGRETQIRDVSIKRTIVGLHIRYGANIGSSDADIINVNIVGSRTKESVGVLVEGFDNTFTNMRISDVYTGLDVRSAGNIFRNIHPLFTLDFSNFEGTSGFYDKCGNNWYNVCYSDNFCYGFREGVNKRGNIYNSCFCMWYSSKGEKHVAFRSDGKFRSVITDSKVDFKAEQKNNILLEVGEKGGRGVLDRVITDEEYLSDGTYREYLKNGLFR